MKQSEALTLLAGWMYPRQDYGDLDRYDYFRARDRYLNMVLVNVARWTDTTVPEDVIIDWAIEATHILIQSLHDGAKEEESE